MSLSSRREYLAVMQARYQVAATRVAKSQILDEIVETLGYNRKYVIRALQRNLQAKPAHVRRRRGRLYTEALPAIQLAWEALDYPCAERLHPALATTVEQLVAHGEIAVTPRARQQLTQISRATLARRLANMPTPKVRRMAPSRAPSPLRSEIPLGRYAWDETRPGALEVDLVEHNGGSSLGHFAYTLTVVDTVSGWSRRQAILGRGQAGVFKALALVLGDWPFRPWGLHSDNGAEFISKNLLRFCHERGLEFTRSRPYKKNDNAHAEQKNRQFVREIVGYGRYDTPEQVAWLNQVYALLDPYANLLLPSRKVVGKTRNGPHLHKAYDAARTPFQRLCEAGTLSPEAQADLQAQIQNLNPLAQHRELEKLIANGQDNLDALATAAD